MKSTLHKLWLILLYILYVFAATSPTSLNPSDDDSHPGLICTPFGICEPCPKDALSEPFCQPFGNRRLMHCVNASLQTPPPSHPPLSLNTTLKSGSGHSFVDFHIEHPEGETPAWESCGRIVTQERADFFEFVACNVFFAAVALALLFSRSKRMEALRTRQLAARIGIVRGARSGVR